jgi:acetyl esterase/lipase
VKGVPHLIVFGDFIEKQALWTRLIVNQQKYFEGLKAAGVQAEWFDLPKMGHKGNSHMLMMDRNSDQIAGLVNDWLVAKGLAAK